MTQALHGMYQADSDAARREFARLAHTTTDGAVRQAAMSEREGAIRIANLAVFYLSADNVDDAPFEVDSIVAECLDLIEISLDVATEQAKGWKALPLEQIRRLRTAKNLLNPCQRLGDRVTDPALKSRLSGWLRILDSLP